MPKRFEIPSYGYSRHFPSSTEIRFESMAEKPVLYYTFLSPPCRSVLLAAAALNVDLELKEVNVLAGEHHEPEFVKVSILCPVI